MRHIRIFFNVLIQNRNLGLIGVFLTFVELLQLLVSLASFLHTNFMVVDNQVKVLNHRKLFGELGLNVFVPFNIFLPN